MPTPFYDTYGHLSPTPGPALAAAASGTAAGTIVPQAAAGTTATITAVSANDNDGNFTINSAGTGQATGNVATVYFANAWSAAPKSVEVTVVTSGASGVPIVASAAVIGTASFQVNVGTALTAASSYIVNYSVNP